MRTRTPVVIAHRGASVERQQNTLEAFQLAVEMGSDWIELDVRRSADDVLVVSHDAHLADGRTIVEHPYDDLPEWLPTLAEALDACGSAQVNIEIKNEPDDPDYDAEHQISDAVVGLALAFREPDELLVSSFNLDTVRRIRSVDDRINVGFVTGYDILQVQMVIDYAVESGMAAIIPFDTTVDRRFVDRAHDAGLEIYPWTVNEPDRMVELLALGVDGIITDTPDIARELIDGDEAQPEGGGGSGGS